MSVREIVFHWFEWYRLLAISLILSAGAVSGLRGGEFQLSDVSTDFLINYCFDCHDGISKKGELNLDDLSLSFDLTDRKSYEKWLHVYDRAKSGEMPPKKKKRPEAGALTAFLNELSGHMLKRDRKRIAESGRAKVRRMNRYEYENTLKELLESPWLQVAHKLPEDGTAHFFNKSGDRLDVSHVQLNAYLDTAEYSIRMAMNAAAFPSTTRKYYAREQKNLTSYFRYSKRGRNQATRSAIPLLGYTPQPEVIRGLEPLTVGNSNPDVREMEAIGFFSGTYSATTKYDFRSVEIPTDGQYKLRFKTYTFNSELNGSNGGADHGLTGGRPAWYRPNRNTAKKGHRTEPITIYALATERNDSRWVGTFDSYPDPMVSEVEAVMRKDEKIRPDAGRLVRTRPGWNGNPNASDEYGVPGFALQWVEVEGPLTSEWPPASYTAIFGDMPFEVDVETRDKASKRVILKPKDQDSAAREVLEQFIAKSLRVESVDATRVDTYFNIYMLGLQFGKSYTDALISALAASLCSPDFWYFETQPGALSSNDIADRLAYFLWNGPPDSELLEANLSQDSQALRTHTERMLVDERSDRFLNQFLDYWLNLREIDTNAPDAELYPDYYLDDQLKEASVIETRKFFRELIDRDLPARNLIDSNFTYVNERLGQHYGLDIEEGVELKRVNLPADSPRGGLLTQASVLRVTANGTSTSPVLRGVWVMERLLGLHIPSPPSGIEAVEPDIRGATTIREQLAKHTSSQSCLACHAKFDPAGFALESFDVAGGFQENYRSIGSEIGKPVEGYGKNGHHFKFRLAEPVDPTGTLNDGREFKDIFDFKKLLLADERAIARNLVTQLVVYATGAKVSFSDREHIEHILDRSEHSGYGVRTLIHQVIQSELFAIK